MVRVWWLGAVVMLGAAAAASAQDSEAVPSPYFDCPYVNYFDTDCPQLRQLWDEREQRLRRQQGAAATDRRPVPAPPADGGESDAAGDKAHELDAGELYPLFPKESLAPDAPPLLRLLLAEPTLDNARRYVRWYARRTARMQAVQALIERAGREVEAGAARERR